MVKPKVRGGREQEKEKQRKRKTMKKGDGKG